MAATLTLRPYQEEALARVEAAEARGVRSLLGVAATGLGKTIMFVELARRRGGRTLILAHRDELIAQAVAKVCESDTARPITAAAYAALVNVGRADLAQAMVNNVGPGTVGIVKAQDNDLTAEVIVASVQTVSRAKRLAQLVGSGQFRTVIVDEAHHSLADSYKRVLGALSAGGEGGPLLFGVTATPERGDGKGLGQLYEEVPFNYDILWGIRAGYLADLRARQIVLAAFDERDLKVSRGDYTEGSSGMALLSAGAPRHIVAAWCEEARDRKTLVFTPTVEMAKLTAEAFVHHDIAAGWLSGETPTVERRYLLDQFRKGDLRVLVNCAVLMEGYDEPSIDCIVVARPTKQQGTYVQMVGRGTRRHPGKDDCLILDVVGATTEHSLVTIPSLFGFGADDDVRRGKKSVATAARDHERELIAAGRLKARDVELFKRLTTSTIAWVGTTDVRSGNPAYVRSLGKDQPTVTLIQRVQGHDAWVCGLVWPDGRKQVLVDHTRLEQAQAVAEDYVRKNGVGQLARRDAAWRSRPPTDRLLEAAAKWKVTPPAGCTAGELSELIDAKAARAQQFKAEKRRARRR